VDCLGGWICTHFLFSHGILTVKGVYWPPKQRRIAMRSNVARKAQHVETAKTPSQVFDFKKLSDIQIAVEAEKACHLTANFEACDFEEFMQQYDMHYCFA
jgi:hypothetical protein